ncbi:type II secretion system protein GspL [Candidatus Electronema sp. TJ]|uniref:type II secretion system protein GspL n=1 Tax=Candidatus Electronema sp. TJ TaxID=3401573 RepID=UPI003AA970F0
MSQISAGIDIGDDLLTGVTVVGAGRDAQVTACASLFRHGSDNLAEELPQLMARLGLSQPLNRCTVGLALSGLNLRNISLPFADEKRIRQVLSFELEEQLLLPIEAQVISTLSASGGENKTALLAATVEKEALSQLLDTLHACGLEPERVCPSLHALGDRLCRTEHTGSDFLLLHGEVSAAQMALIRHGEILFMRRLAWPDEVFTRTVFRYEDGGIRATDPEAAVSSLCDLVRRSLDYFAMQSGMAAVRPEYFILSGTMLLCPGFSGLLEAGLGLPGRTGDLTRDGAASLSASAAGQWQPALYDAALALALHQTGRRGRDAGLNFRQGEFAPPRRLLGSKKQLIALASAVGLLLIAGGGWLLLDGRMRQRQQDRLTVNMNKIFEESFPGVKPGPDPLMHMRSLRKGIGGSAEVMPIFADEKRALFVLADISARIPSSIQLQVDRFLLDQNSVTIKGTTDAFNNVNAIQSLLSKSSRYTEVRIVSATKGKQEEGIQFELRLQLRAVGGAS